MHLSDGPIVLIYIMHWWCHFVTKYPYITWHANVCVWVPDLIIQREELPNDRLLRHVNPVVFLTVKRMQQSHNSFKDYWGDMFDRKKKIFFISRVLLRHSFVGIFFLPLYFFSFGLECFLCEWLFPTLSFENVGRGNENVWKHKYDYYSIPFSSNGFSYSRWSPYIYMYCTCAMQQEKNSQLHDVSRRSNSSLEIQ